MIPAMTSREEQDCFRRLAYEQANYGAVVELGAWLGACTFAIATGIEQAGAANAVHSYDHFRWNPRDHARKAGFHVQNMFEAYKQNIAPVSGYVHPHKCDITDSKWDGGTIALLICDAPKRFKVVQHALSEFGTWLRKGSVMAWQDFSFPPAYAIPTSLYRLRQHFAFRECAHECTAVFGIKSPWQHADVTLDKLEGDWTIPELAAVSDFWRGILPSRTYAGVACGLAMFLSDLGHIEAAKGLAKQSDQGPLQRLRVTHPRLRMRYEDLFRGLS